MMTEEADETNSVFFGEAITVSKGPTRKTFSGLSFGEYFLYIENYLRWMVVQRQTNYR
jgi:hypothetical protein